MLADARRVRVSLGSRLLLAGSVALVVLAAGAAWTWVRQARQLLEREPDRAAAAVSAEVVAGVRAELRAPVPEVATALRAARAAREAALAVPLTERQRRRWEPPALLGLLQHELEDSGLAVAWLRQPGAGLTWSWHGGPLAADAAPLDGACVAAVPGRERDLARCLEVPVGDAVPGVLAGGLRRLEAVGAPGEWALFLTGDDSEPWRAGPDWQGLDVEVLLAELPARSDGTGMRMLGPTGRSRVRATPVADLPLRLVVVVPGPAALTWPELVRGRAGTLTHDWRRFLAGVGAVLAAGLLLLTWLAVRLRRALAPLVQSVGRVGREALPPGLPLERTDEIGVVAAGLADLGTSLRATRQALERAAGASAWRDVGRALAHELKNPLLPLRGTIENLVRWRREEPERFDRLFEARAETVLGEIDHLARLADTLGQLSRLPEPRPTRGDLEALARDVARLHAEGAAAVGVDDGLAGVLTEAHFDRVQMRQLFSNLLKNAVEAMGPAGGRITLLSGAGEAGERWIAVEDDGPGAGSGDLERLFRPGMTTKAGEGGQGVGLFLCRRIAQEHGGRLEAVAPGERGLRFTLTLPPASAER